MKEFLKGDLIQRQNAIFYYAGDEDGKMLLHPSDVELYTHMFVEDAGLAIIPIGGRSKRAGFAIRISPPNPDVEELICDALEQRDYGDSLANAVYEFFRLVAGAVCADETAAFEIAYQYEPGSNKPCGFDLFYINERQIRRRFGRTYQYVPPKTAKQAGTKRMIRLPTEELVVFKSPSGLEDKLHVLLKRLSLVSRLRTGQLTLMAMQSDLPYKFAEHHRSMNLVVAEASQPLGWNARGLLNEHILSYYSLRQWVLFQRFKIRLRNSILETLNDGIRRAGKKLGFEAEIVIDGLPSLKDVEIAINLMESASLPFTEIMKTLEV